MWQWDGKEVWQWDESMTSRTRVWQAGREYGKQDESMASRTIKILLARQEWYLFLKFSHKVTAEMGRPGALNLG